MGSYLNPSNIRFQKSSRSQIYIDKSELLAKTNRLINTEQQFLCVSRPRRFGKSMGMEMLSAYYSYGQDSAPLFKNLKIADDPSYRKHLNQYNVIKINMQMLLSETKSVDALIETIKKYVLSECFYQYPNIFYLDKQNFTQTLADVYSATDHAFIILIDEWDCLFREYKNDQESQNKYLDFLRLWMKDQAYVALAYMTGILPIKKYGTHSALNMFTEYSMIDPGDLAPYFGFTEDEVKALCEEYHMSFEEAKAWYDGYALDVNQKDKIIHYDMYSPKSMVEAMLKYRYDTYWNRTETYEALKDYIARNEEGLKDDIIAMIAGESIPCDIYGFVNDMITFNQKDDILTLLIHLGYLSYNFVDKTVRIPNKEVSQEYVTSIKRIDHFSEVARSVEASKKLLKSLWDLDSDAVAQGIDQTHNEISILKYNDENSLSCCISLAFYYAKEYYTIFRELPTGKGFADICLIPRKLFADKPAVIIELKKDRSAKGAIDQIKNKEYVDSLKEYQGNLLLCGINYDTKTKKHDCVIEKLVLG